MNKLFKISWLNVKNSIHSKVFLLGIVAAFFYSMLWVFVAHPSKYGLWEYDFEIGRFLFVIMLYVAASIFRDDIRFNTSKAVFSGIFSRVQVTLLKIISLIIWAVIFSMIVEINNVIIACILYKKIGIMGFINFNHLQLIITYIVTMLAMGSLIMLITLIIFKENKSILFFIVFLSMVNFYTAAIVVSVNRQPEIVHHLTGYMLTPFYNTVALAQGYFNMRSIVINLVWALIFIFSSIIVVRRMEIR